VSLPKYPSEWGGHDITRWSMQLAKNEDVCVLTGVYADAGEGAPQDADRGTPSLSEILRYVLPDRVPAAARSITEVRFDGPRDGQLRISGWHEGMQLFSIATTRTSSPRFWNPAPGQYGCAENGTVTLSYGRSLGGTELFTYSHSWDVFLARGPKGWLIAKLTRAEGGMVMEVPGFAFRHRWYRFPPAPTILGPEKRPGTD